MNNQNVAIIQDVYAAFGRGDVPAILAHVDEETEWSFNVGNSEVPWHAKVAGKAEVPRFLGDFVQNVALQAFEPRDFIASGNDVIAHIHIEYQMQRSGKAVNMDQLHWWTLNPEGKIVRLVHFEDTAQVIGAYANG